MNFSAKIEDIEGKLNDVDPVSYAQTRNYSNGAVTFLSPYISRGVLSTKKVFNHLISLDLGWEKIEKLVQELAWRDYWQNVWVEKGDQIHTDLKQAQQAVSNYQIPEAIVHASTGIEAVDSAIKTLYKTGYMHNHMRMYVASICCNIANSHWLEPAKWMYAHLYDGDIASNQLSWQWVAGAFSKKKYFANQDNINHFFESSQKNTFLDISYESFEKLKTPNILTETIPLNIDLELPEMTNQSLIENKNTLVFNYYNLDPYWHSGEDFQKVLLIEPSIFKKYLISSNSINFAIELSKNIKEIKLFVGEFEDLLKFIKPEKLTYKEHPLNNHYKGFEEPREWLSSVKGYFPSFFSFWKKCKKELRQ